LRRDGTAGGGGKRLPPSFYRRDTLEVARDLLGRVVCRRVEHTGRVLRGRIVEVEAYDGPNDRASHAHRGRTARNAAMFEAGGIAYVYRIYGVHHCLNVVSGERGYPAAVLIRATEPPDGAPATGPGCVCRAFAIDRRLDGESLLEGRELWLEEGSPIADEREVRRTPRIGMGGSAGAWWARRAFRLVVRGHPAVSGPRRLR
jgi:DNA-3-methyladenine glycosylase